MMAQPGILAIFLTMIMVAGCSRPQNGDSNVLLGPDAGDDASADAASDDATTQGDADRDDGSADMAPPEPPYDDCALTVWPQPTARDNFAMLQEALFDVEVGGVVCLVDGQYSFREEVSLDTPNVEIRGESQDGTILDFAEQTEGANGISATSDGVVFSSFTIRNTPGDAIRVTGADGVAFRDVTVTWSGGPQQDNGAYGLYPVQCQNVLIEGCVVSHASDAGIYVGQSMNIIVRDNEAFGNVAGIEIENSTGADVYNNHSHGNTGGLLIFDLPSPPIQGGNSNKIHDNVIENNNEPNFAEPGNIVGLVPAGTGVLVLASDRNEIHENTINGNQSIGIAVVSFQTTGQPFDFNPDFDPYAEGNWVHDNVLFDNGGQPRGFVSLVTEAASLDTLESLLWDGYLDETKENADGSLTNCFSDNVDDQGQPAGYRMFDAPNGFSDQVTDIGANECEGAPLDATVVD